MGEKIIGIIGGMGPEATADLMKKIVKATDVIKEEDHLRVIVDSNPKIPDRTASLLGKGPSPVPVIIEMGKNLEKIGCEVIGIPCVSAHSFIAEIRQGISCYVVDVLGELAQVLRKGYPQVEKIGILSTTGPIKAGLFEKYFSSYSLLYPSAKTQERKVMEAIYGLTGLKRGIAEEFSTKLLLEAGLELIRAGAQIFVQGCSEMPLVLRPEYYSVPLLDPNENFGQGAG